MTCYRRNQGGSGDEAFDGAVGGLNVRGHMTCESHVDVSVHQLSPKKTWEGFIGGFFSTVVFGFLVSSSAAAPAVGAVRSLTGVPLCPQLAYLLSQFQYFVCPVGFNSESNSFTIECEPSEIFVLQEYTLPAALRDTLRWVRSPLSTALHIGSHAPSPRPDV